MSYLLYTPSGVRTWDIRRPNMGEFRDTGGCRQRNATGPISVKVERSYLAGLVILKVLCVFEAAYGTNAQGRGLQITPPGPHLAY